MSEGVFEWNKSINRLNYLQKELKKPLLWSNTNKAQKIIKEKEQLLTKINDIEIFNQNINDIEEFLQLIKNNLNLDNIKEINKELLILTKQGQKLRLESLLSGEYDSNNCFIEIHSGAGGTESQDWAEMLQRMYIRWTENQNFKTKCLHTNIGEEAGIKSSTYQIIGKMAYGWLKNENGIHRLVRISPFDSSSRRHTSFASISVYPEVNKTISISILDEELRIDTYRASGAGGQHTNKTDSAVRITHIPTRIVVQCQNSRSQHRNRAQAIHMLKSKLFEKQIKKQKDELKAQHEKKTNIGWGHHIRSYILHPYQMVKDLRTNISTGNTYKVLNGDLNDFLEAALLKNI